MLNLVKTLIVAGVVALLSLSGARAQSTSVPLHFISLATTNSTLVFKPAGGNGVRLNGGVVGNPTGGTAAYLKFYNKATAPTCGTDTPQWTILLPVGASVPLPDTSAFFSLGLGFCITALVADNDNTNATAGIVVNLAVSGR